MAQRRRRSNDVEVAGCPSRLLADSIGESQDGPAQGALGSGADTQGQPLLDGAVTVIQDGLPVDWRSQADLGFVVGPAPILA